MEQYTILQVIGGLNRGGAETMLMNLYRKLDRTKFKFVFLTYNAGKQDDYDQEIYDNGDEIIKINGNHQSNPILLYRDLKQIMNNRHFDCVHAHTLFNSAVAMVVAKQANVKVRITHSHSSGVMKKNNLINRTYFAISRYLIKKDSTHFVACDQKSGEYLFGTPFKGIVLKNGVDLTKFNPTTKVKYELDENLSKPNKIKLAAISSFYTVKNHKFMIEIAKRLDEKKIDFVMYFVGRGPLQAEIENKIAEYHLEKKVILLGVLNNVNELLPGLDFVLMPSLYEGIPVSLIEAQASGVPAIISTNISKDVDLKMGLIDFLEIENNYDEWVDHILESKAQKVTNPEYIKNVFIKNGYSVEKNLEKICKVYEGE